MQKINADINDILKRMNRNKFDREDKSMFEIKQFNSGEYEVKLVERITDAVAVICWNWFKEKDLMLQLLKIDAIKRVYGNSKQIILRANYLPYLRQDRVFEAGLGIPSEVLLQVLLQHAIIETHGAHSFNNKYQIKSIKVSLRGEQFGWRYKYVYPDKNAFKHFWGNESSSYIILDKQRTESGIKSTIATVCENCVHPEDIGIQPFLICDDICDGGRTFIEAAKLLREKYAKDIPIYLMVYHAFLTHGIDTIKESGISKIIIINPDSYEYCTARFPDDLTFFERY
jgi:ribose-phosphate pyrophosphokinase